MFLQSNPAGQLTQFIFPLLLILVLYLFFIRPQAKKQKVQKQFEQSLDKGKKIVTTSGIIGTITKLDDEIVTIQISQKGFMDVLRTAISAEMTEAINK